jgi:hypothetical protein
MSKKVFMIPSRVAITFFWYRVCRKQRKHRYDTCPGRDSNSVLAEYKPDALQRVCKSTYTSVMRGRLKQGVSRRTSKERGKRNEARAYRQGPSQNTGVCQASFVSGFPVKFQTACNLVSKE